MHTRRHVKRILLVSTPARARAMEQAGFRPVGTDGDSAAPEFVLTRSIDQALLTLGQSPCDLALIDQALEEGGLRGLLRLHERDHELPLLLMADEQQARLSEDEERALPANARLVIWSSDPEWLRSMVRFYEDEINHATLLGGNAAFAVLVVDRNPAFYSRYLTAFYQVLREQSASLLPPEQRPSSPWVDIASRPLLLLRTRYDDAVALIDRFPTNLLTLITDMTFVVNGQEELDAGLRLILRLKSHNHFTPALVQSSNRNWAEMASKIGAWFVPKDSPFLQEQIKEFFRAFCGFGPFVFQLPGFTEFGRAENLQQLRNLVAEVPLIVFEFHALHNHFSTWLSVHGYGELSLRVRKLALHQRDVRATLLEQFDEQLRRERVAGAGSAR